jgi:hypothetical protein
VHEPRPFFGGPDGLAPTVGGGVACTCGVRFTIGDAYPDTPMGNPSKKKRDDHEKMLGGVRDHWAAEQASA